MYCRPLENRREVGGSSERALAVENSATYPSRLGLGAGSPADSPEPGTLGCPDPWGGGRARHLAGDPPQSVRGGELFSLAVVRAGAEPFCRYLFSPGSDRFCHWC